MKQHISSRFNIIYDKTKDNKYDTDYYMKLTEQAGIRTVVLTRDGILKYLKRRGSTEEYYEAEKFFMDVEL